MKNPAIPPLAFLDVETTGLSAAYNDKICEIAVLKRFPEGEITHWQSLVNPLRSLSPGASHINGITNDMVKDSPSFPEVADTLLEMLNGTVLVCHNAPFDLSFISAELGACGKTVPCVSVIDTLRVAREYFSFPSNSLGNIADYLGIEAKEKHRALADVYMTYRIFENFWAELSRRGMKDINELIVARSTIPSRNKSKVNLPPLLEEAMKSRQKVKLHYESSAGVQTRRVITPLEIVSDFDYLYLVAFCQLRKEKRIFRLDRIIDLKPLP